MYEAMIPEDKRPLFTCNKHVYDDLSTREGESLLNSSNETIFESMLMDQLEF